ncbi:MAG: Gldg family protein, partial [Spirochaetes bacterium]|nr:Gldg family protein [Spirochaetota bacterium]
MKKIQQVDLKNIQSWIIFILIILNLIAFIMINNRLYFRLDMTEGKKYSIGKATVDLLKKVQAKNSESSNEEYSPLIIEYYYNKRMLEINQFAQVIQYIKDLLAEYDKYGKNDVKVYVKELSYADDKHKDEIERIENAGIQAFSLMQREETGSKSLNGFSGIILKYNNEQKVMPTVISDQSFEFDLDVEIKKIIGDRQEKLGILVGSAERKLNQDYAYVYQLTHSEYEEVTEITSGQPIDKDIDILIIIGGSALTEADVYQIDQFLLSGGKAFVALGGINLRFSQQYGQLMIMGEPNPNSLNNLLAHYGLKINLDVVGDNNSYRPLQQAESLFTVKEYRYPVWPEIKNFSKDHVAVSDLQAVDMFWPSSITIDEKIKDQTDILFRTTKEAWVQTSEQGFRINLQDFEYPVQQSQGEFVLACAYQGDAESYFNSNPIPEIISPEMQSSKIDSGKIQLVVLSNEMMLESEMLKNFSLSQGREELLFLMNTIDWFSKESSLIQIRNKSKFTKPLDKAVDKADFKKKKSRIIFVSLFIMPLLVVLLAVIIFMTNKSRNKKII